MQEEWFIPISALNQYTYCPLRCWYMHVACEFVDNIHTVEGSLLHERVDTGEGTRRGELWQIRSVYLYSKTYGLVGKADLIEERSGELYPVEFKKGRRGDWGNDKIQLCAQALALEEMLKREIPRGFLYYAATGRRQEVRFTEDLRQETLITIDRVRELLRSGARPSVSYVAKKCKGCSLYRICLPRETALIKKQLTGRTRSV
ncbi:MAG: CRISPR-associated protein Cas4 [Nitrospinota bacterium]|nr:MAG: CRISPR-associated protein Cas4 [Nitrospinota bacterium]